MKPYFKLIVLMLSVVFCLDAAGKSLRCLQNQHTFGLIATSTYLDDFEQTLPPEPPLSKTGKSYVTQNQMGFDVIEQSTDSWLIQKIIAFSKSAQRPMLDIGGGYGQLSHLMLQQGATVIYNDLDMRHLIYGRKLASTQERERLYLNTFDFPQGMILKPQSLSGVVLHRVAHLMAPDRFEEGLAKIHHWLIPGGKVFIAVLPPQHGEYRDKVLPIYELHVKNGDRWPGRDFKSQALLPDQAYALPKTLNVMDKRPLEAVLTRYGFIIEQEGFIEMKKFATNPQKRDGKELYGIIARKG